nr:hypothetical protein [Tanacetum cinerariifolium]
MACSGLPSMRKIDNKYLEFGKEIRNIRFGLSSDRMNPFGNMSSCYSTWPVLLCMYNLPPWLCMKRKYIMMSLLLSQVFYLNTVFGKEKGRQIKQGTWKKVNFLGVGILEGFGKMFHHPFFNAMVHQVSHSVSEIKALGPIHLHYMFPFERFMGVVKGYARNQSRPEGSIVEGYASEEVIDFYTNYLEGIKGIGVPRSLHVGRLHKFLSSSLWLWDDTHRLTPLEIDQVAYMILNEFYRAVATPLDRTAPQ